MKNLKMFRNLIHSKLLIYFSVILLTTVMLTSSVVAVAQIDQNEGKESDGGLTYDLNAPTPSVNQQSNGYNVFGNGHGKNSQIGPNVQVNDPQVPYPDGFLGRSETSIAASNDGRHLVAGWNDAEGFCGAPYGVDCPPAGGLSGYAYSTDGGYTWTDGGAPPVVNNVYTRGDPWLDSNGKIFFYANLAVNNNTGDSVGVSVHRGHFTNFGNFVWTDVTTFDSPTNIANPGSDFYDKESITVAKDGSGAAYVSVTNFQETCGIPQFGYGTIELWRTHDNGNTWQGPTIVSPDQSFSLDPNDPACGYYGSVQQGSVVAIGPHGEVYVTWVKGLTYTDQVLPYYISPYSQIMEATSFDGGRTFTTPVVVATINAMNYDAPVAYNRQTILDSPRISVATSGLHRGRVYVTYFGAVDPILNPDPTVQNLTSSQVYLAYSDNNGRTWKQSEVITPPPQTTVKRFWPVVVTEKTGAVDIVYYQSIENPDTSTSVCNMRIQGGLYRTGLAHSLVDVYWVHSTNGGFSFTNPQQVTSVTSDWCSVSSNIYPNMGDYIGATANNNYVYVVWADGRNGVPDTFFARIHGTHAFF